MMPKERAFISHFMKIQYKVPTDLVTRPRTNFIKTSIKTKLLVGLP